MGALLPKAVESTVVKRCTTPLFRVGFAEVNGWRKTMEDAHVILAKDRWGFFGVFDGHGGSQCSNFVAKRLMEELEQGPPADDQGVKELMLRLDGEFIATGQPSGSTGTFAIVSDADNNGQYSVRIGNVGDSRVLLGCTDGSMVVGSGTDGAFTTDHKPDQLGERARIERTGGEVKFISNVARVNGDLAVSRAFGDAAYKRTGGPGQEDRPVTAAPEFSNYLCKSTHFLALVCDGISEGQFPNREVVKLVADELRKTGDKLDPGKAAAAVCRKALASGSNDNLSCLVVLLGSGGEACTEVTFEPGPFTLPTHGSFRKAYAASAEHAGLSLAQALEMRFTTAARLKTTAAAGQIVALRDELALFGEGPPDHWTEGSEERVRWFGEWLDSQVVEADPDFSAGSLGSLSREQLMAYAQRYPEMIARLAPSAQMQLGANARSRKPVRKARIAAVAQLKEAVEATSTLKWVDRLEETCGQEGDVMSDDPSDNTSKVLFPQLGFSAWLPRSALTDLISETTEDAKAHAGTTPEEAASEKDPKRPRVS